MEPGRRGTYIVRAHREGRVSSVRRHMSVRGRILLSWLLCRWPDIGRSGRISVRRGWRTGSAEHILLPLKTALVDLKGNILGRDQGVLNRLDHLGREHGLVA